MGARYLIRFDDICETMNWKVWDLIEPRLVELDIKPIVAIVPENKDPSLIAGQSNSQFWLRARRWQSWGWSIGWHGYQHLYDSPSAGVIGLNRRSEFAGHSSSIQTARLRAAHEIFRANDVLPELWVAPGHSFDLITVRSLQIFGIDAISDGLFTRPVRYHGATWLPQQLWKFRRMPFGLWTICCHINAWSADVSRTFLEDLTVFRDSITSVSEVRRLDCRRKSGVDVVFAELYRCGVLGRRAARRFASMIGSRRVMER